MTTKPCANVIGVHRDKGDVRALACSCATAAASAESALKHRADRKSGDAGGGDCCRRGDLNPKTGEISLNLGLNSKTGEKSPDRGAHANMLANAACLVSSELLRLAAEPT
jgi:hypothetical protein